MSRVVDNTVLSNFCLVDQLDILRTLVGKVYVTYEVREEVFRGLDEGYGFMSRAAQEIGVGADSWLELTGFETSAEEQSFREFAEVLGFGEASCLALSHHRHWMVLTDDKSARRRLQREKLPFTGTLGILKLAILLLGRRRSYRAPPLRFQLPPRSPSRRIMPAGRLNLGTLRM